MLTKKDKIIAWLIGTGLIFTSIHQVNQPLLEYLFLPQLGALLVIILSARYLLYLKKDEIDFGSKWLYIPLLIITTILVIRPFYALLTHDTIWGMKLEWSNAAYGLALFSLYLTSRKLGTEIFKPFLAGTIIASVSCIVFGLITPGTRNGGLIAITNYDIATGFIVFGLIVSTLQSRWWLSSIALIGLYFTGAEEAIFVIGVLIITIIIRRDFNRKILLPIGALIITITITIPFQIPQNLYISTIQRVAAVEALLPFNKTYLSTEVAQAKTSFITEGITNKGTTDELLNIATGDRYLNHWNIKELKLLGYGYNTNQFSFGMIHNVPLIIIEQLGLIAAFAWTFAIIYLLIKTKWRYAWIAFIALGVFDHFTWTQLSFYFWALAGASSASNIKSDLIFKEVNNGIYRIPIQGERTTGKR